MRASPSLLLFLGVSTAIALPLGDRFVGARREIFLPGPTSNGHHQIEQKCELCHDADRREVVQERCVGCHGEELAAADDTHPLTKFLDPRNAEYLDKLDARRCVTCHTEHRPAWTDEIAVSLPRDLCVACHAGVASDRPSHAGLSFATCQDAGCHNYHDNRALKADFLRRHLDPDEPDLLPNAAVPARTSTTTSTDGVVDPTHADAPPERMQKDALAGWSASAHARAGVRCSDCHAGVDDDTGVRRWVQRPDPRFCRRCHEGQVDRFERGRHGMRFAAGLSPMNPALARLPMREAARHDAVGCASCHDAHRVDVRASAAEACLGCHADRHSLAWSRSPHGRPESGVTCATCHLPRLPDPKTGGTVADHAQNENLRPREKMLRSVCQHCHGVAFALAALSDDGAVGTNFASAPRSVARSVEMLRSWPTGGTP